MFYLGNRRGKVKESSELKLDKVSLYICQNFLRKPSKKFSDLNARLVPYICQRDFEHMNIDSFDKLILKKLLLRELEHC